MWFPIVQTPAEIRLSENSRWQISELLELLQNPQRQELRNKVGVTADRDGSARQSTRLLQSGAWFFKTETAQKTTRCSSALAACHKAQKQHKLHPGLWHPEKEWVVVRWEEGWTPVSVCPVLTTLRSASTIEALFTGWRELLITAIHWSVYEGVGLDLNPSNFGYDSHSTLYYIDDELFPPLTPQDIGEFLAAMIPQHTMLQENDWFDWGELVKETLHSEFSSLDEWLQLQEGLQSYPLTERFQKARQRLMQGLVENNLFLDPRVRRRKRLAQAAKNRSSNEPVSEKTPLHDKVEPVLEVLSKDASDPEPQSHNLLYRDKQKTCVFSDVHGNLPALEAVLKKAEQLGVDSYLCLGDIVGYGPFPSECIQRVKEIPDCIVLRGNHDQMMVEGVIPDNVNRLAREVAEWTLKTLSSDEKQWLESLLLEYGEDNWLAVHSAPVDNSRLYAYVYELTYRDNLEWMQDNRIEACFYGHTHVPFGYGLQENNKESRLASPVIPLFQGNTWLLNPGSVGQPRDRDCRASFAIWDHQAQTWETHRVSYNLGLTIDALHHRGLSEELGMRLEMGW